MYHFVRFSLHNFINSTSKRDWQRTKTVQDQKGWRLKARQESKQATQALKGLAYLIFVPIIIAFSYQWSCDVKWDFFQYIYFFLLAKKLFGSSFSSWETTNPPPYWLNMGIWFHCFSFHSWSLFTQWFVFPLTDVYRTKTESSFELIN